MESKLESVVKSTEAVCEVIVQKAITDVVQIISKQQDPGERKQKDSFNLLSNQISALITQLRPSSSISQLSSLPVLSQAGSQCNICGITFGFKRALSNHTMKEQEPN